jgi:transposase
MKQQRRKHSAEFKARVALEAVRGIKTISEIAQEYEIHPIQVSNWKKELLDRLPEIFDRKGETKDRDKDREQEHLHKKIGQLTMEVDWLEKKCKQLNLPIDRR